MQNRVERHSQWTHPNSEEKERVDGARIVGGAD